MKCIECHEVEVDPAVSFACKACNDAVDLDGLDADGDYHR